MLTLVACESVPPAKENAATWNVDFGIEGKLIGCAIDVNMNDASAPNPCPMPFPHFLLYLEDKANVNIQELKMPCHDIQVESKKDVAGDITAREYTIKRAKTICFRAKQVNKSEVDESNVGSFAVVGKASKSWDWKTGMHNKGLLCIRDRVVYRDANGGNELVPDKVGIYLEESIVLNANVPAKLT